MALYKFLINKPAAVSVDSSQTALGASSPKKYSCILPSFLKHLHLCYTDIERFHHSVYDKKILIID